VDTEFWLYPHPRPFLNLKNWVKISFQQHDNGGGPKTLIKERRNLTKGQLMPRKYTTHPSFGEDLIAVKSLPHTL
jgi:hypothetical protein